MLRTSPKTTVGGALVSFFEIFDISIFYNYFKPIIYEIKYLYLFFRKC